MNNMERLRRIRLYTLKVERWLIYIKSHFRDINEEEGLTADDKKRLKEYYLETCITPRIREAIAKYFPEESGKNMPPNQESRTTTP